VIETGVFVLREEANQIAEVLTDNVSASLSFSLYKSWQQNLSAQNYFRSIYKNHEQWLLIMTTGIAVRFLDGQIESKLTDPSVVVMDEASRFAISLIGGHEGGANKLAYEVANVFGCIPVITTATESLKPLVLGVGCRKNVSVEQIENCLELAFRNSALSLDMVRVVATVDLKKDEPALLEFCEKHKLSLQIFDRNNLKARAWVSKSSEWVKEVVGADGVCEPCALMVSPRGQLVVPKTTLDGVAVAIVQDSQLSIVSEGTVSVG
jgi:cobalt-precorrin 5A hydrolase